MLTKANHIQLSINPRRTALAFGGLLAAGYLSSAVAHADHYIYYDGSSVDPVVSEEGLPPFYEEIAGLQLYNVADVTDGGATVGTFEANTYDAHILGLNDTQIVVTDDLTGTNDPSVGSVFDYLSFGTPSADGSTFTNVYSDVVGANGNTITDTVETPWGDFNIPTNFDAALFLDAENGFDAPCAAADVSPLLDFLSAF
jgi:hypothetical protein